MSALIEIEPTHITSSGQRYRVYHDGSVLMDSTREPMTNAARALSKMGVTGRLQARRRGSSRIDMEGLISVLATRCVTETELHGPRLKVYKEPDFSRLVGV